MGGAAARLSDGRVLVSGGRNAGSGLSTTSAEIFDPETGQWSSAGDVILGRYFHHLVPLPDGDALVVGGVPTLLERYDGATGEFTRLTTSLAARAGTPAAIELADGSILLSGSAWLESFDVGNATLHPAGTPLAERSSHSMTSLTDGRVLIVGGIRPGETRTPCSASWETARSTRARTWP